MPSCLRAAETALIQGLRLPAADFFLLTILPALFLVKFDFFKPLLVDAFLPEKTCRFSVDARTGFFFLPLVVLLLLLRFPPCKSIGIEMLCCFVFFFFICNEKKKIILSNINTLYSLFRV